MKTEEELNADILALTNTIQEKYPEVYKSIEEMPVTIPDKQSPEINIKNLQNYYNSLLSLVEKYKVNTDINLSKKLSPLFKLIFAVLICEGAGIVSGLLVNANSDWFNTLNKPTWNPPAYIFAPVWAILYLLMAISLWLIWKNKTPERNKRNQYFLFGSQLFLNFWWSIIFFNFHSPAFALVDIILMLILITLTIFSFLHYSRLAAWLLVPYIAWVAFATILNYSIWSLNH